MSANEVDLVKQELSKIRSRYDAFINDLEELRKLSPETYKQTSFKDGLVIKASKNAESILKYVCKASNVIVTVGPNKTGTPVFHDYIFHAYNKGLINDNLKSRFEQIRSTRNTSAHHDGPETFNLEHDELSIHTVEVIKGALTYITDWFFHQFLNNKYPDLSLKTSIPKEQPIEYKKYEPTLVAEGPKAPISPNIPKHPIPKTDKIRKKYIRFVLISIGIIGLIISIFYALNGRFGKESTSLVNQNSPLINEATANTSPDLNSSIKVPEENNSRKLAQKILQAYYDSIAAHTFVANDFFADDIDEFKGLLQSSAEKDIEPKDITRLISKSKFEINHDFTIQNSNLNLNNSKSPFPIWKYVCSSNELIENDDTNRKIIIEFSFNAELKLKSLKENYVEDEFEGS
jgi:hypothetical protein